MVLKTTFVTVSFIGGGKPVYPQKTTNLPQVTNTLSHNIVSSIHLAMSGIRTHNISDDRD